MARVRVVHWKAAEAAPLLAACRAAGHQVEYEPADLPATAKIIRRTLPEALVIDLSRRPSAGRELAFAIRHTKYTRHIPLVFAGGETEKVEAIRQQLPDAVFTPLQTVARGIKSAGGQKLANPAEPPTVRERYAGRTTAQKLGIREGTRVGLYDAPRNYSAVLGELPPEVELEEDPETVHSVSLWFVQDPFEYAAGLRTKRAVAARSKLWVIWRKGGATGLGDKIIRERANEAGLVDYKICSVDSQWSGMVFAVRKK